jgi:N-acyl homoserine lactone hydrolase
VISIEFAVLDDTSLASFVLGRDLFGDGSLVLLSTPEHPSGSLSLLVRQRGAVALLLAGEITYPGRWQRLGRGVSA